MEIDFERTSTDKIWDLAKKIQGEAKAKCGDFDEIFDLLDSIEAHAKEIIDLATTMRDDCPSPPDGLTRFRDMVHKQVWVEA